LQEQNINFACNLILLLTLLRPRIMNGSFPAEKKNEDRGSRGLRGWNAALFSYPRHPRHPRFVSFPLLTCRPVAVTLLLRVPVFLRPWRKFGCWPLTPVAERSAAPDWWRAFLQQRSHGSAPDPGRR
jgi:hypothetical protein